MSSWSASRTNGMGGVRTSRDGSVADATVEGRGAREVTDHSRARGARRGSAAPTAGSDRAAARAAGGVLVTRDTRICACECVYVERGRGVCVSHKHTKPEV